MMDPTSFMKFSNLSLYRQLIKRLKKYPSLSNHSLYLEAKELFRLNRGLVDEKLIALERKKAAMGLAHIEMYIEQNAYLMKNSSTFSASYQTLNPRDDTFVYF